MQFHSGCTLAIFDGLGKSCRTSLKNGVSMIRAAEAERTTLDGKARKAWPSYLCVTGAHISDCRQTGGGCLAVVELASLVASCGGDRPRTNATNQCLDWKGHTSNTTCSYLCMCYLEPTGLHESTRWESTHDLDEKISSWYVCSNHGTKFCGMLITYADR